MMGKGKRKTEIRMLAIAAAVAMTVQAQPANAFTFTGGPVYDAVNDSLKAWGWALLDAAEAAASAAQLAAKEFFGSADIYMKTGQASVASAASSQNVAAAKQRIEGLDQLGERQKIQDAQQKGAMKSLDITEESMPSIVGCSSATSAQMVGSPASAAVNAAVIQQMANSAFMSKSEPNNLGARVASHFTDREQCDATDVAQQRNGCSSVGSRAGADMLVASLFMGAGTGSAKLASGYSAPNYTFTPEQFQTASRALANIGASNMPTLIDPKAEATPAGRGYLAMSNIVKARYSMVQDALASIMSKRASGDVSGSAVSAKVKEGWDAYASAFAKAYPGRPRPENPSEYEALRLSVLRRSGDASYAETLQDVSPQKLMAEKEALLADTNMLLFNMYEQYEKKTMLLSGLLAQQLDPVNKDMLNSQRDAAMRSAGGR